MSSQLLVKAVESDRITMSAEKKNGDLCYVTPNVKLQLVVNLKQNKIPKELVNLGEMIFQVIYSQCQLVLLHVVRDIDKDRVRKHLPICKPILPEV